MSKENIDTPLTDALKREWNAKESARNSTTSPEAHEIYDLAESLEFANIHLKGELALANEILAIAQARMSVWVLTSEYNDHDQHGEYFEAVFGEKPTSEQIQKACGVPEIGAIHILNGGGRKGLENQWYILNEYNIGAIDRTALDEEIRKALLKAEAGKFYPKWRLLSDIPHKTGRYIVAHAGNQAGSAYYTAKKGDTHYPVGWSQVPDIRPTHWLDMWAPFDLPNSLTPTSQQSTEPSE